MLDKPHDAKTKSVRASVTFPAEDYVELERIAENHKVSVAWVVRKAVDEYLGAQSPLFRTNRATN